MYPEKGMSRHGPRETQIRAGDPDKLAAEILETDTNRKHKRKLSETEVRPPDGTLAGPLGSTLFHHAPECPRPGCNRRRADN